MKLKDDRQRQLAEFRFGVIAPLICRRLDNAERQELRREILNQVFIEPGGKTKRVGERTLRSWISKYNTYGFDGLVRVARKDIGMCRAIAPEVLNQAYLLRRELPTRSITGILAHHRAGGTDISKIDKKTLNRYLNNKGAPKEKVGRERGIFQRWQKERANDLWQCDSSGGVWLPNPANPQKYKQTRLLSFIDDATRVMPHAEFYWDEQLPSLVDCFRKALLKRGKPRRLLCDNAFIYHSTVLRSACAQLGIELSFCMEYSPESKGKVERSYGTVKGRFYEEAKHAGLSTLDELNKFWFAWLTYEYHQSKHSALNMTPIQRWQQDEDADFVQQISAEQIDRALMVREIRKADIQTGIIRLNNHCYQLKPELAGKEVEVLYETDKSCGTVEIWKNGRLVEIATKVVPGADIDFNRKPKKRMDTKHQIFASSRDYKLALIAAHQNEPRLMQNI